jgi:hypothetical protein
VLEPLPHRRDLILLSPLQLVLQRQRVGLVLLNLAVPQRGDLLPLELVRLLDPDPLGVLPRRQGLAPPTLLVRAQLLEPVLCDLSLDILALPLTVAPVLLQNVAVSGGKGGGCSGDVVILVGGWLR